MLCLLKCGKGPPNFAKPGTHQDKLSCNRKVGISFLQPGWVYVVGVRAEGCRGSGVGLFGDHGLRRSNVQGSGAAKQWQYGFRV